MNSSGLSRWLLWALSSVQGKTVLRRAPYPPNHRHLNSTCSVSVSPEYSSVRTPRCLSDHPVHISTWLACNLSLGLVWNSEGQAQDLGLHPAWHADCPRQHAFMKTYSVGHTFSPLDFPWSGLKSVSFRPSCRWNFWGQTLYISLSDSRRWRVAARSRGFKSLGSYRASRRTCLRLFQEPSDPASDLLP